MNTKKLFFLTLSTSFLISLNGCASSSFKEYFNDPVIAPVVEKSFNSQTKNPHNNSFKYQNKKNEENKVETFEVK